MTPVHFTANYLIQPTNPVTINLIGAGGTGSQMLTALAKMNHALISLGHAGLFVNLWDSDKVTQANLGRQLFASAELGLNKAVALINRTNRFFGTNWKAIPYRYAKNHSDRIVLNLPDKSANLIISCVDTAAARFEIADILKGSGRGYARNQMYYWMDFGNSQYTGQVMLSTINKIDQPKSALYKPKAILPFVTEEYKETLASVNEEDTPSCSLAEALQKQDLFINSTLANMGCALLWNLFRNGMTENRGFFLNLKDFRTQPVKV